MIKVIPLVENTTSDKNLKCIPSFAFKNVHIPGILLFAHNKTSLFLGISLTFWLVFSNAVVFLGSVKRFQYRFAEFF